MAAMMQRNLNPNDLSGRHSVLRRNDEFFTFADFLKLEEYNTMPFKSILRKATELGIFITTLTTLILAGCGGGGGSSTATPASTTATSDISSYLNEVGGINIWFGGISASSVPYINGAVVSNRGLSASGINSYAITDSTFSGSPLNTASGVWVNFPSATSGVQYYSLLPSGWQLLPASATYVNNGDGTLTYSMGGQPILVTLTRIDLAGSSVSCVNPMGSFTVGQVAGWTMTSTIFVAPFTCPVPNTTYPAGSRAYMTNENQATDAYFLYDYSAAASPVVNVLTDAAGSAVSAVPAIGTRFCWNGAVYDPISSAVSGTVNYNVHYASSCTQTNIATAVGSQTSQTALVTQYATGIPPFLTVRLTSTMMVAPPTNSFVIAWNNSKWMTGNYVAPNVTKRLWLNKAATNAQLSAYGGAVPLP